MGRIAINGMRKVVPSPMSVSPQRTANALAPVRSLAAVVAFLLAWQFLVPLVNIPDYVLPLPSVIASRFAETFTLQLASLAVTAMTTLAGLAIALVVGVLLALLVVYVEGVKSVIMPFLAAFNSIPKIAIAPLFVIWFGLGAESKILLAFLFALFPIFVNSMTGLGEIEPDILDLAQPGHRIDEDREQRQQEREQDLRLGAQAEPDDEQRRDRDLRNAVERGEERHDHALHRLDIDDEEREQHADDERDRQSGERRHRGDAEIDELQCEGFGEAMRDHRRKRQDVSGDV